VLTAKAARLLRDSDVSADVLMHFTNSKGEIIKDGPVVVGPTVEEFMQIPFRLAVAAGPDKVDAIDSALRSGLITALATDASTAAELLNVTRQ
jgi:deoxyribonucleoside regulator